MEVALGLIMLCMPLLAKYLLAYMALGVPALWFAVRISEDDIDYTDKDLITNSYIAWPVILVSVLGERSCQFIKYIGGISYNIIEMMGKVLESSLQLVAGNAEDKKRLIKSKAKKAKLEALEVRVQMLKLTECSRYTDIDYDDDGTDSAWIDPLEEKFKALIEV